MNHSIIELFARPYILHSPSSAATMQTPCTQRSDRSCKVIYCGRKVRKKDERGSGRRMTGYIGFPGHCCPVFDVAMFYPARTPENGAVRPASPCLARAFGARSVSRYLSIAKPTATFLVRVMRSKLGETSREATRTRCALR